MELQEVSELIYNNIGILKQINRYKSILNRGNNLLRFDVLNRILIELQNSKAYDLKDYNEWLLVNREIIKKEKPIYIVSPKTTSEYIDIKSGKPIEKDDLTQPEILKALKYKIIRREDTIETLYTVPVFDIRQTKKLNKDIKYDVNKPILNTAALLQLVINITGAELEICDDLSYYSKSDNKIYIQKSSYKELASTIAEMITQHYISDNTFKNITKQRFDNENYFQENEIDILKSSLTYALTTLFASDKDKGFDRLSELSINKILNILYLVDDIVMSVIPLLKFNTNENMDDAITNIKRIKKSEVILDILSANNINKKLKGM